MWQKLKAAWRYILVIAGLIAAFIGGLASAFALRGNKDRQSGLAGNQSTGGELAAGLGAIEENQLSARRRIDDLAESNKRAASGQREASRIIDSAEAKLDRLDDILGKYKDL